MCYELEFLLREAGDPEAKVEKTGIRGLVVAQTVINPMEAVGKFRAILRERPYEFRYALRIIPVQKVVHTNLEEIKAAATELTAHIAENETFRVTVEKRFTNTHSRDIIEAIAANMKNKVDLKEPDKIILVEVLGGYTGVSVVTPVDIISVLKEKML